MERVQCVKWILRKSVVQALIGVVLLTGCATSGLNSGQTPGREFDPKAAEKARPYFSNLTSVDLRTASLNGVCSEPKVGSEWKIAVQAASACVQKQDWITLEKLAGRMAASEIDSPWGAYFLGVAAANRGDMLRADWMFDLSEKKAGAPLGLVRYERARLTDRDEGAAAAVNDMKAAVRLDPTLLPALLWLAQLHHRDRMMSEAEVYYRLALQLKSDSYPAVSGLGDILFENKAGPEAAELLTRAMILRPEIAETRVKLAIVYETVTKEPAKAIQVLRELRVALERGRARGKISLDISAKIKTIEQTMKPEANVQAREREPAQDKKRPPAESKRGG